MANNKKTYPVLEASALRSLDHTEYKDCGYIIKSLSSAELHVIVQNNLTVLLDL